jgi:catechol 2,3-dioxygenase-like lactoylglutathione lyase family enzyme
MEHIIANMLQNFEEGKISRRQLIQSLALAATAAAASAMPVAAAASDSNAIQAVSINHIAYEVADYGKSRDWYGHMFDLKLVSDDHKGKAQLALGDAALVFHSRGGGIPDHLCVNIADWDNDKTIRDTVGAELKRRNTIEAQAPNPRSFFIKDPDGYMVQMGGKNQ